MNVTTRFSGARASVRALGFRGGAASRAGRPVAPGLGRSLRCEQLRRDGAGPVSANQQEEDVSVDRTPEETTEKFGLEVGLFKTLTAKNKDGSEKKASAKGLLTKYGSAYLLTSISFAIVSFSLCYFLVSVGIDVPALLGKLGLHVSSGGEKVGRVAIAYAAHKAASPIRFPPTVALTPVVAQLMGKKGEDEQKQDDAIKNE
mmetsp:Transcript_31246/g.67315  ORF Transcript_31246/g.67315 Transcript_31246/m.67315 type:complete len:202 (+) Transcript_31246:86-691(+)